MIYNIRDALISTSLDGLLHLNIQATFLHRCYTIHIFTEGKQIDLL